MPTVTVPPIVLVLRPPYKHPHVCAYCGRRCTKGQIIAYAERVATGRKVLPAGHSRCVTSRLFGLGVKWSTRRDPRL